MHYLIDFINGDSTNLHEFSIPQNMVIKSSIPVGPDRILLFPNKNAILIITHNKLHLVTQTI